VVHADWPEDRPLPWDHLQGPLPRATLAAHRRGAFAGGAFSGDAFAGDVEVDAAMASESPEAPAPQAETNP
jgi:hypothetical protein